MSDRINDVIMLGVVIGRMMVRKVFYMDRLLMSVVFLSLVGMELN